MRNPVVSTGVLAAGLVCGLVAESLAQDQPTRPQAKAARRAMDRIDPPQDGSLGEGDGAPDFTLKTVDGKREVALSRYRGRQPVVLIFGSYT